MILLRTSYIGTGSSSNIILTCNLVRLGVYMVKICHEKMLTLEMYPSKILNSYIWITVIYYYISHIMKLLQKKITSHPLENFEHPDKKLNSLEIILIP